MSHEVCALSVRGALLTVDLIVFPAKTLRDANTSPLLLREQSQGAGVIRVEEVLRDHLEERFG